MVQKLSSANSHQLFRVSGLASGIDSNALIEAMVKLERIPIDRKIGQRDLLGFQQKKLQNINLKLFDLRNKATDLTFSKAFNAKTATSSNDGVVTATPGNEAVAGSFNVVVDQLATASRVTSAASLSPVLQKGRYRESTDRLDGLNLGADKVAAGLSGIDFSITINGSEQLLNLAAVTPTSSLSEIRDTVNSQITANSSLNGKIKLDYDFANGNLSFKSLDANADFTIQDKTGDFIDEFFVAGGNFVLDEGQTIQTDRVGITRGLDQTLSQLGITPGDLQLDFNGTGAQNIDLSTLNGNSTLDDFLDRANAQIADNGTLKYKVRFSFDSAEQKVRLELNNAFDATSSLTFADNGGDFGAELFGSPAFGAGLDSPTTLGNESFSQSLSSGVFTVDGVRISVNNTTDTLQTVLNRITNSTAINAEYDSQTDKITLRRKDGSNVAIGIGAKTDTSNFLSVTGLSLASQASSATVTSTSSVGAISASNAESSQLNAIAGSFNTPLLATASGLLDVTVNGVTTQIAYDSQAGGDTLNEVLDRISEIEGVGRASYNSATGKVVISGADRGSQYSLSIVEADGSGGNLADSLNFSSATVSGRKIGDRIESKSPLSRAVLSNPLASAGLITAPTEGTFTINGQSFSVGSTDTLNSVINRINANTNAGVTASYDSESNRLSLKAKDTGNQSIRIGGDNDTSNFLYATGLSRATQEVGGNAIYSVDGGASVTSASNTIEEVVAGVTLKLLNTSDAGGETITIGSNTESTKKSIKDFVESYNTLVEEVNKELTSKRDYDLQPLTAEDKESLSEDEIKTYEERLQQGLLANDPTLSLIQRRFRQEVFGVISGLGSDFNSLASIGLTSGPIGAPASETRIGKIHIVDEAKLDNALANDTDAVRKIFTQDSSSSTGKGIARRIKEVSSEFSDFDGILTRKAGRSGVRGNSELDKQILRLETSIANQEAALFKKEDDYAQKFARLEQRISEINSSGQQLLSSFTGKS